MPLKTTHILGPPQSCLSNPQLCPKHQTFGWSCLLDIFTWMCQFQFKPSIFKTKLVIFLQTFLFPSMFSTPVSIISVPLGTHTKNLEIIIGTFISTNHQDLSILLP